MMRWACRQTCTWRAPTSTAGEQSSAHTYCVTQSCLTTSAPADLWGFELRVTLGGDSISATKALTDEYATSDTLGRLSSVTQLVVALPQMVPELAADQRGRDGASAL